MRYCSRLGVLDWGFPLVCAWFVRNTVRQRCQLQDWTEQSRLSPARQTLAQLADGQSYNGHGEGLGSASSVPQAPPRYPQWYRRRGEAFGHL